MSGSEQSTDLPGPIDLGRGGSTSDASPEVSTRRTSEISLFDADRTDALRQRLLVRIASQSRRADPADTRTEECAGLGSVFDCLVSCLAEGRGLTVDERRSMEEVGAVRARDGIPVETVQHDVQEMFESLHWSLFETARTEEPGRMRLEIVGELSLSLAQLALDATESISSGHTSATDDAACRNRWEVALVETILRGNWTEDERGRLADRYGRGMQTPAALSVLVMPRATPPEARSLSARLLDAVPEGMLGHVRARPCPHAVHVVVDVDQPALTDLRRRLEQFGEANDARLILDSAELGRLGAHYRRVRGDIDLVPVIAGDDVVVSGEDLRMYQVLAGCEENLAVTFVRETLGSILGLPPAQRDPLIATLLAFQDGDGTIAQSAARLELSPKGVAY